MKKSRLIIISTILVLILAGCKEKNVTVDINDHYASIENLENVQFTKIFGYTIGGTNNETVGYYYLNNETGDMCSTPLVNNPNESEHTVSCNMVFTTYQDDEVGIYPYVNEQNKFGVYPVYQEYRIDKIFLNQLNDPDSSLQDGDVITVLKEVMFKDLSHFLKEVVSGGQKVEDTSSKVYISGIFDTTTGYFSSFRVDFADFLNGVYVENLGNNPGFEEYYLEIEVVELNEKLAFYVPSTDLIFDDNVDYIEDGEKLGFQFLDLNVELNGVFEFVEDQEILVLNVPIAGYYKLDWVTNDNEERMAFKVFNKFMELIFEGEVGNDEFDMSAQLLEKDQYYLLIEPIENTYDYTITFLTANE